MREAAAVFTLLAAAAPGAAAQRPIPSGVIERGTLAFGGHATAGDFTGTTSDVSGALAGGASLADVRGWVEAPVATLVTGNDRRDRDLNKSMESERHPTMRFDLAGVRPEWERGDSAGVVLVGTLLLHGVARDREIPATVHFRPDETIRLEASFPVNLKDHRIGGLSKFLGVLRMHPDIEVRVDLTFRPGEPPAPPDPE